MKYKYNITHKLKGKKAVVNFKNEKSMIKHLDANQDKINQWTNVYVNFVTVSLPLKSTVWFNRPEAKQTTTAETVSKPRKKSARSKEKMAEDRRLKKFIKRLES